jgi:hypothetical protein
MTKSAKNTNIKFLDEYKVDAAIIIETWLNKKIKLS